MTAVGLQPRRVVRVGVRARSGIAVGTAEQQVAFAGEDDADSSLVIGDDYPRAVALQAHEPFGMAFQGRRLFTAVGGRQGAVGPAGNSTTMRVAGEALSALRAVYERGGRVYALSPSEPAAPVGLLLGITVTAAAEGSPVLIKREGTIDDPSFDWDEGLVFVGLGGRLTQVYPTTGWELVVGASPSPTRLNVDFDEPVLLAQD